MPEKLERYSALDGIRVFAMVGILVMHVLANVPYREELRWAYDYIKYFGDFTALFMMVSGFSVSCGYYERILTGDFEVITKFYKKRYSKILPFFLVLSVVDIVLSPSMGSVFEGFANVSLGFGLIPHESITVIGVGWTLGVIFVFYLLYPFFVYCMSSKIRFSILTLFAVFFAFISNEYFGLGKVDFLYCLIYFVVGCGLYIYRDFVKRTNRWIWFVPMVLTGSAFFCSSMAHTAFKLLFFTFLTAYAISIQSGKTILSNKCMAFFTTYSFEIYLCHMVSYRVCEKMNLLQIVDNTILSYAFVCIFVFALSFMIAYGFKYLESRVIRMIGHKS